MGEGGLSPLRLRVRLGARAAGYGLHMVGERVRPPRVEEPGDVPRGWRDLNPGYLTRVLCAGVPGAEVTGMEFGEPNEGTTSRRTMRVFYNPAGQEAGLPTALFTKSSTSFTSRVLTGLLGLIDAEAAFYNVVRPKLAIEAARGYHCVLHRPSARSMFILEDVGATRGAVFGNPVSLRVTQPVRKRWSVRWRRITRSSGTAAG